MSPETAHWIAILFSAAFGGAIGSFLNVVVYRLPNRLSLILPPSHCPMCKTPIRWHDNVPVFGWIMLGGKCRQCRCSIPIRYPAVEAFTAAMFAALAWGENPLQPVYPDYLILLCYHVTLLCTLLCSALIEIDGNRPPLRLFVPAIIVGIATPLVWPPIIQLAGLPGLHSTCAVDAIDVLAGPVAGVGLSIAIWLLMQAWRRARAQSDFDTTPPSTGLLLGLICAGTFFGWLVLGVLALVTLTIHILLLCPGRGQPRVFAPPSVWLLVATIAWILV
jgi:leader peptidase (prepilin peptidase) / N-methyltransferase